MKNIIVGLTALMLADIIMGLCLSKLKEEISLNKILEILFKALVIVVSTGLIYYCGYLNPTILTVNMNGEEVNLIEALQMIFIASIVYYGYKDISKLTEILRIENTYSINSISFDPNDYPVIEEESIENTDIPLEIEKINEEEMIEEIKG